MKKTLKKLGGLLMALCMTLALLPATVLAADSSVGTEIELATALTNAVNGDTITLTADISGNFSYAGSAGKTVTIDGGGKTIRGIADDTAALTLSGGGTLILKSISLRGGEGTNFSYGLYVNSGSPINVQSEGTVDAVGWNSPSGNSFGLYHGGSGTVRISAAVGGQGSGSVGVRNVNNGTVYAGTAIGGTADSSIGVDNVGSGTVNVGNASGGTAVTASYGVNNRAGGVVNAVSAVGGRSGSSQSDNVPSYGVANWGAGTVNVASAIAGTAYESHGVHNSGSGTVNANVACGGSDSMNIYESCGAANCAGGTINVTTAVGGISSSNSYGAQNYGVAYSVLNVKNASYGECGTSRGDAIGSSVHKGPNVATLTLNKGAGAFCVLDSITVALPVVGRPATSVGVLPTVSKNGVAGAWYTDKDRTTPFSGTTVNGLTALYSSFYATPPTGTDITADFTDANFLAFVRVALGKGPTDPIYDTDIDSVTSLIVSNRHIASLAGLEHFTELTELYCPYNQLTALDVSKNTKLTKLECSSNQLTALDVSKNTALTMLKCFRNQLTALDVSKNTALTMLECPYNQLTVLDVSKNTALTKLDCSYNYMPNEAAITGLNKTLTTTFTFEPQSTPPTGTDITADFTDANFLAAVRVALGKGSTDPIYNTDVASVTSLHVSFKNIASLAGLEHFTELTELYCAYNQLTALDVSKNTELIELGCTGNQLTALDVSKNTELTKLECVYNQLTALDVSKNTALTMLKCTRNQLTALDVSKNTVLTALDCSYNYMPNEAAITGLNKTLTTTFTFEPQSTPSGIAPTITSADHTSIPAKGGTFHVTATGTAPLTYSLTGAPNGVSIDSSTGLITMDSLCRIYAGTDKSFTVTVSNGTAPDATKSFTLTILDTPYIQMAGLNNGTVGVAYSSTLRALGSGTITWSVTSGSLPAGLSLSGDTISGTPTTAGNFTFTLMATNANGSDTVTYTIKINPASTAGGGGGGGGGSATTTTTTTPTTTVSGTTATTTVTPTVSGGVATGSVTTAQMSDALKKAQAATGTNGTPNVKIQSSGASGASSVGTTIPHASLQALSSGGVGALTISGPTGSVSFDASALKTISGASGDVTVTVAKADSSTLSDADQALVGNHPVFTFSVTGGGSAISQFGGEVTVSVPYTPAPGEDTKAIVIYYIAADGTPTLVPDARYDAATGTVIFTTTHFSTYAVAYNKVSFTDVSATAWYAGAVTFLSARDITSGTAESTFSPDAALTRGQIITMLLRAYGVSADTNTTDNFVDAGDTYYTGYLAAAKRLGITSGVGDNLFAPEQAITRQEMFTLLYNALKVLDKLPSGDSGKTLSDFADAGNVASWAREAMTALIKSGTITGSNSELNPTDTTTRAEMAQVLYNLLAK